MGSFRKWGEDGNMVLEACACKFGLGSQARKFSRGSYASDIYFHMITCFPWGHGDNEMNCNSPGEKYQDAELDATGNGSEVSQVLDELRMTGQTYGE